MVQCEQNGDVIIKNWDKRQETNLTGAERVKNFRERQKNKENKGENDFVTSDVTNVTLDKNRIDKNRVYTDTQVSKFTKPTLEEVTAYCKERNNNVDPQQFVDHYESNGWRVGGRSAMKDWKASVRTWEKNNFQRGGSKQPANVYKNESNGSMDKIKAKVTKQ